jgi:ABC-2 type transport system ATP-binding protein
MLELQNLSKSYRGIPAIANINFQVNAGEVVGYLGANGSGKSTTVKITVIYQEWNTCSWWAG